MSLGQLNLNYDAATGGLYYKDSAGGVVKVGPAQISSDAPNSSPAPGGSSGNSAGEFWFDSTNNLLKVYNGSVWKNPVPNGSTSVAGILQLTDSTSSTSTTTAATPNSVKSAYDLANAALPKSGGTVTGNITLNAQSDLRFADADSTNWVAFQAPATVPNDVTWTLPATDGTSGEVLSTNGAGTLDWVPLTQDILQTKQVIEQDITLTTGYNGFSVGPVTVADGYEVTVPEDSTWFIQNTDPEPPFPLNDYTISVSYSIPYGKNASSVGPVSLNEGVEITVPQYSTWMIL